MERSRADQREKKVAIHNEAVERVALRPQQWKDHLKLTAMMGVHRQPLDNQFILVGEDDVLYYASNLLVLKNLADGSSVFLQKESRLRNVTALTSTYRDEFQKEGLRWVIVAGESSLPAEQRKSLITIISIDINGGVQWRTIPTNQRNRILSLQLNYSKKLCGCLTQHPLSGVPSLMVWKLGKDNLIVNYTFKPTQCNRFTFDHLNERQLLTMNDSCVRLWEVNAQQRSLKQRQVVLRDFKDATYRDWTWLTVGQQTLLVVISRSKIFIVVDGQLRKEVSFDRQQLKIRKSNILQKQIERSLEQIYQMKQIFDCKLKQATYSRQEQKDQPMDNNLQLRCLMHKCFVKGKDRQRWPIMVGTSNGLVMQYDIDRHLQLTHSQSFQVAAESEMQFLYINQTATVMACISKHVSTQELHFDIVRMSMFDTEEEPVLDFFGEGAHSSTILSLSAAVMKDVFVSSAADRTLRVWDYGSELETRSAMSIRFKEEPLDAALHPLGMLLAVNFKTEIRVFAVLSSQLHPIKSIRHVQDCRWLRFSHYGHFLISNEYSSIKLYEAVSFRLVGCYEVDESKCWLVRCYLTADDQQFVVVLNTGATCVVDIKQGHQKVRIPDTYDHLEPYGYKHILYDNKVKIGGKQGSLFVGTNQYKYLSIYTNRCKNLVAEFPITDCTIEAMCLAKEVNVTLVGTSLGTIRLYNWPIDQGSCLMEVVTGNQVRFNPPTCYEVNVHSRHVKAIEVRDDCEYAIVGSDDGTISVVELLGFDQRRVDKNRQQIIKGREDRKKLMATMNNLFLMRASDVQSKNQMIRKSELDVLRAEQAISRERVRRQKQLEQLRQRTRKQLQQSLQQQNQLRDQNLQRQSKQLSSLQEAYQQNLREFQEQAQKARLEHQQRKQYQLQRNQQVRDQIAALSEKHKQDLQLLIKEHKSEINRIRNEFKQKNEVVRVQFEQLMKQAQSVGKDRPAENEEFEPFEQTDECIITLQTENEQLRMSNEYLKQRNQSVQRIYEQKKKEDERMQCEFQQLFEKHNEIRLKNLKSDQEIVKLQHQLLERLQVIDFKTEVCREGRQYQRNLENFKFVLDDKIDGLQKQKQLILANIHEKQQELEKMFNELIEESQRSEQREQEIAHLRGKLAVVENQTRKGELHIVFNLNRLAMIQQRLETLVQVDDPNKAAILLRQLIEQASNEQQLTTLLRKPNLDRKDIRQLARMKQESTSNENEELLKYGKWMTKKLNLMKVTSKKVRDIKQGNINIVLKQNQRLLEQCNQLRTQNHAYDREIDRAEYMIKDVSKQQKNYRAMRAQQSNFSRLQKRFMENQAGLDQQHRKINEMLDSVI